MKTTLHTIETAPEASRPLLQGAQRAFGFIPNLLANFANAPAALEGYLSIGKIFGKTSLSPTEQQIVLIAASVDNGCDYCVAAHTTIGQGQKIDPAILEALRDDDPLPDGKLEALRRFAKAVVRDRGSVGEAEQSAFLTAGYTEAQALEVVLGITMKILSNYANHLTGTPLDEAFQANAWSAPVTA